MGFALTTTGFLGLEAAFMLFVNVTERNGHRGCVPRGDRRARARARRTCQKILGFTLPCTANWAWHLQPCDDAARGLGRSYCCAAVNARAGPASPAQSAERVDMHCRSGEQRSGDLGFIV
jgi:hypothetical protein